MRIMIVDDEELMVENLVNVLKKVHPKADLITFFKPEEGLSYLSSHAVDIALLDIEMEPFSGLVLAMKCKELCPCINIIFVTGYDRYALDAMRLHASGYLLKPVRADDLRTEFENLRHPPSVSNHRVRIQTFGNFEIFVNGNPLKFPRSKCKECLAYLVDRKGAGVTYAQLSAILWESQPIRINDQNNTNKVVSELMKTLKKEDAADIIFRTRKEIALDVSKVDCDYFLTLQGDMAWMNTFTGEYMSNYSWAEFTLGALIEIRDRSFF